MKQKIENPSDTSLEECIKLLEPSGQSLAHDRALSSPKRQNFARGGGETGLQHQLYLDLNETKDTPCIGRYIRRIYQTLGGIEQTPGLSEGGEFPPNQKTRQEGNWGYIISLGAI